VLDGAVQMFLLALVLVLFGITMWLMIAEVDSERLDEERLLDLKSRGEPIDPQLQARIRKGRRLRHGGKPISLPVERGLETSMILLVLGGAFVMYVLWGRMRAAATAVQVNLGANQKAR